MSYFKTINAETLAAFKQWRGSVTAHGEAARALSEELGASTKKVCRYGDGRFAAFFFEDGQEVPGYFRKFSDYPGAYLPRRSTREGRAIAERVRDLPRVLTPDEFNRSIGFHCQLMGMRFLEFPPCFCSDETVYFWVPDDVVFNPPDHCREILGSEYRLAEETLKNKNKD